MYWHLLDSTLHQVVTSCYYVEHFAPKILSCLMWHGKTRALHVGILAAVIYNLMLYNLDILLKENLSQKMRWKWQLHSISCFVRLNIVSDCGRALQLQRSWASSDVFHPVPKSCIGHKSFGCKSKAIFSP